MASKTERVILNIAGNEVGVFYEPATSEWGEADEHAAYELGLIALCQRCMDKRAQRGLRIPGVLIALIEAGTYRELM